MAREIGPGVRLRVLDASGLRLPGGKKAPFKAGDELVCDHVTRSGNVVLVGVQGMFRAHRFLVLP